MINWGNNNPLYLAYQRIQEEREVGRSMAQRGNSEKLSLIETGLVIAANIIKEIQKEKSDLVNTNPVNYKKMWEELRGMTKEWVGDELPDIYAVDDNTYTYHLHKHQFCKDLLCQMEEMENI